MTATVGRWNFETREYEPYQLPENTRLYTWNMDLEVSCAECARTTTFGECYTSMRIHTEIGIGYPVCENCYTLEHEARRAATREYVDDK